jgi:hypothetical protein
LHVPLRRLIRGLLLCGGVTAVMSAAGVACGSFGGTEPPVADGAEASPGGDGATADADVDGPTQTDGAGPCTADIVRDTANCGACGHECKSGCFLGVCTPTPIELMEVPLGALAHVAVDGTSAAVTDGIPFAGPSLSGYVYSFDPTKLAPQPLLVRAGQRGPGLVVTHGPEVYWTHTGDTLLTNKGGTALIAAGGTFEELAISPSGATLAARKLGPNDAISIEIFDSQLAPVRSIPASTARGVAFADDSAVIAGAVTGVLRCPVTVTPCAEVVKTDTPVTALALAAGKVFFITSSGDLRSAPLPSSETAQLLEPGFTSASAIAVDSTGGILVLDSKGLYTTRYGPRIPLVRNGGAAPVLSFAVSGPWVYFVTTKGLFRIRG